MVNSQLRFSFVIACTVQADIVYCIFLKIVPILQLRLQFPYTKIENKTSSYAYFQK